jgi:hypothetical protein
MPTTTCIPIIPHLLMTMSTTRVMIALDSNIIILAVRNYIWIKTSTIDRWQVHWNLTISSLTKFVLVLCYAQWSTMLHDFNWLILQSHVVRSSTVSQVCWGVYAQADYSIMGYYLVPKPRWKLFM